MGEAFVLGVGGKPNTIDVRIVRDTSRINAAILAMATTISSLEADIVKREILVTSAEVELASAEASLQIAIDDEEPREVIVKLQEEVIVATSNLVNTKTDLAVAKYKLLAAKQRKTILDAELFASNNEIVAIPMADSGTSILPSTSIGIAEVARQSGRGSLFVALPSERPGHSVLYEEARDGNIIPKLAEQDRGWFYNEMIEPSAQIFRPRYWTAFLLFKDDVENEGTIATEASGNYNTRPFNNILYSNVVFEYETTNSLTFQVGDLVLVEFSSAGVPTIIGFANTGEKPEVFGIARYEYVGDTFGASLNNATFQIRTPNPPDPIPTETEEVSTTNAQGSRGEALQLALDGLEDSAPGWTLIPSANSPAFETSYHVITFIGFDSGFVSDGGKVKKALFSNGKLVEPVRAAIGGTVVKDGEPSESFTSIGRSKFRLALGHSSINPEGVGNLNNEYQVQQGPTTPTETTDSGSFNLASAGQQSQEFDKTTTYSKLNSLNGWTYSVSGVDMPNDWLFDNSNYVTPPEDNQYLTLTRIDKIEPISTGTLFDRISFWQSFGPPSDSYVCNPIATNGTQNLLKWSERLDASLPDQQQNGLILEEGVLKSPDCVEDGSGVLRSIFTAGFIFQFFNRTVNLIDTQDYVFSAFVRRDSYMFIEFGVLNEATTQFDLKAGSEDVSARTGNQGVNDAGIIAHDGEWWRVWITFTNAGTNSEQLKLRIYDRPVLSSPSPTLLSNFASNGLNGVAIWGMQVHEGITPQTYVKTTGAIVP